jgi:phosphoglycerate dehydrogenase-like enzyme
MKLLISVPHSFALWTPPAWFAERLKRDFPAIEIVNLADYKRVDEEIVDAEVAITWSIRPEQVEAAKKLRWIHSTAAAVHTLIFPELVNSEIVITNAREVHGRVVAEHVIALIFALAKKIHHAAAFQSKHEWAQLRMWEEWPRVREVAGATVGLVGLGSIGRAVAKHAKALGMRVIAARENPGTGTDGADAVFGPEQIDEVFKQADYVVLAAPTTANTKSIASAARIALMKLAACLINVGRGSLVDEAALANALRNKKIGGAALDVFDKEPLPAESPLWDVPNLLITPHTAGLTEMQWERHYELFSENLRRYIKGEPLLAVVDKKAGY